MRRRVTGMAAAVAVVAASVAVAVLPATVRGQDRPAAMKMSSVPDSPEWQKLKALAGRWDGVMEEGGKQMPTGLEIRMTGDGSAIMHLMDKDTPHEMVTMIHPDGKRIVATHYCAAHNQPRMAAVLPSKAPGEVAFDFIDGTNIGPGEGHMRRLVIRFVDADHHEAHWTFRSAGGDGTAVFRYTRKK